MRIVNLFKSNLLIILIFLPLLANLLNNIFQDSDIISNLSYVNLVNFLSVCLGSVFYLNLFMKINKYLKIQSITLTSLFFLISYFLFDSIFVFLSKNFSFSISYLIVSSLWLLILIFKKIKILDISSIGLTYFLFRYFNHKYFDILSNNLKYQELNSDVPYQWNQIVSMIYNENYFYSLTNNPISGQGLLLSHIQALLLKINFDTENFIFIKSNYNLIIFFSLLFIFDLDIKKKNKVICCLSFILILINNDWLYYLITNSLMLEGLASLLFAVFTYYFLQFLTTKNRASKFFFLCFGSLVLSKNFITLIVFFLMLTSLFFLKKNKDVIYAFIPYIFYLTYQRIYSAEVQTFAYTNEIDFNKLLLDLFYLRNLELQNILNILKQFLIDKPTSYLFILFFLTSVYYISKSSKRFSFIQLSFIIVILNYLLVNILYVSYWQNVEYESSYRYIINTFHLVFITLCINLNYFEVLSKNKRI